METWIWVALGALLVLLGVMGAALRWRKRRGHAARETGARSGRPGEPTAGFTIKLKDNKVPDDRYPLW